MRTVRPYRIAGYVVVGSGVAWDVDSQHIYRDTQDWVLWAEQFKSVALVELLTEKMKGDEAVLPWWAPIEALQNARLPGMLALVIPKPPVSRATWLLWRLKASWLNFGRRRANRKAAKKEQLYFSAGEVQKRMRASQ